MSATVTQPTHIPSRFAHGFSFLWRGAGELRRTPGAWWLMVVPVFINLALFVGLVVWLINITPTLMGWFTFGAWGGWVVLAWIIAVFVYAAIVILYAFLFSIVAEVLGAPFYEEIGVRVDKRHGAAIVERPWYQEVWLAIVQESQKLAVLLVIGFAMFLLQFLPGIGQILSIVGGVTILAVTLGGDAVGPALARRGYMLGDRRRWVLKHLMVVSGLGAAKAIGLIIPILNTVVLPFAAAGGTLLVQKYDA